MGDRVPKTHEIAPIHVGFLLFNGFQPIDLSGPWQAFTTANEEIGRNVYQLATFGSVPEAKTWDGGLKFVVEHSLKQKCQFGLHTIIVPGGNGVHNAALDFEILEWLRHQNSTTIRTCSVCTGVFLLASTGMLEGQRVTTHWRAADQLRTSFPNLDVAEDKIFCESEKFWTTAGVTAGIDMALALIERDCGVSISQRVARRLLVYLRRNGDQRQYSQMLRIQDGTAAEFRTLIEKIDKNIASVWTVEDMASECLMSRRSFQRKFKQCFGMSSQEALKSLRKEKARLLLASGDGTKKEIARQVGLSIADLTGQNNGD